MDERNNPEQQENRSTQQSSEFYNRPGSTEHNDYHISGKNENLSVDKKEKRNSENDNQNAEAIDNKQQAIDD